MVLAAILQPLQLLVVGHIIMIGGKVAQGFRFVCGGCAHTIEAWDEGNPYYIDDDGKKQYAYHPSDKRDLCIGNDSPHLCLSYGHEFMPDSACKGEHKAW